MAVHTNAWISGRVYTRKEKTGYSFSCKKPRQPPRVIGNWTRDAYGSRMERHVEFKISPYMRVFEGWEIIKIWRKPGNLESMKYENVRLFTWAALMKKSWLARSPSNPGRLRSLPFVKVCQVLYEICKAPISATFSFLVTFQSNWNTFHPSRPQPRTTNLQEDTHTHTYIYVHIYFCQPVQQRRSRKIEPSSRNSWRKAWQRIRSSPPTSSKTRAWSRAIDRRSYRDPMAVGVDGGRKRAGSRGRSPNRGSRAPRTRVRRPRTTTRLSS